MFIPAGWDNDKKISILYENMHRYTLLYTLLGLYIIQLVGKAGVYIWSGDPLFDHCLSVGLAVCLSFCLSVDTHLFLLIAQNTEFEEQATFYFILF